MLIQFTRDMSRRRSVSFLWLLSALSVAFGTGCRSSKPDVNFATDPPTQIVFTPNRHSTIEKTTITDKQTLDAIAELLSNVRWDRLDGALSAVPEGTLMIVSKEGKKTDITLISDALIIDETIARITRAQSAELKRILDRQAKASP